MTVRLSTYGKKKMRDYAIDADIIKNILRCSGVTRVDWRISASRKGFHFRWTCTKRNCRMCARIERLNDDPSHYLRDRKRAPHQRRVLWDAKGSRHAGAWHTVVVAPSKHYTP